MATTTEPEPRDREELLHYVERFALVLADTGMPRTAARVFAYALTADGDRHTAGELAAGLRLSPAAVSGAVRHLLGIGLLVRERELGSRSDLYRVNGEDVWYELYRERVRVIRGYAATAADGVRLLGADRPGARRLAETRAFFDFIGVEMADVVERWHERGRRTTEAADGSGAADGRRQQPAARAAGR